MLILLAILAIIATEVYLLIKVGTAIGAFKTTMILVGTAVLGLILAQLEGFAIVRKLTIKLKANEPLTDPAIECVFLIAGAFLLILPGFISHLIGFLFIIPPTRRYFAVRVSPGFRRKIEEIAEKKRQEFTAKSGQGSPDIRNISK